MNGPKKKIEGALHQFTSGDLAENAKQLFKELGYESERTIRLKPNTPGGFLKAFDQDPERPMNPDRAMVEEWDSIDFIFQLTKDEVPYIRESSVNCGSGEYNQQAYESYLFFALKLKGSHYTRTQLSQITREINNSFKMPAMILFQHGGELAFAVIDRRLNGRYPDKDVLLKTTLIKGINFADHHRAHIDILFDLYIAELHREHQFSNFPELHEAWRKTLDTEALNRQFYLRLFNWFQWATSEAKFPESEKRTLKPEEHVIRLITRLLFVWFIKEKGLVPDELFNETQVARLLKDYDRETGDSYYRAVLQNLFFATLNAEIGKREFSPQTNDKHRDFSVYRYKDQIADTDKLLELLAETPFVNGGLFDCLDSFKGTKDGGYRIDCFSDVHYHILSIPNSLFFDNNHGLIPLLKHYKFTVEESTPIEQEVALDPELLGRVFENLLATYDPETGESKRKQTGSYYTPRAIVDYMVEEALVATLVEQVSSTDGNVKFWKDRLRYLFDYAQVRDDASKWFDNDETDKLVRAISELKVLDPAVGSGAFPMGVLHKLTLALRRLDLDNSRWEQLQRDRAGTRARAAFKISNQPERDDELKEISDTFERYRDSDFGRKLYLIQNSIFGVDIQPEACQIAKLRFFISLAIEQVPDQAADNFGIKPLPNLETRFVAANTLISLQLSEALPLLQDDSVRKLIKEIEGIRERHFLANNRRQKLNLEDLEGGCREQLKEELERQRTKWVESQQREIERKIAQLPNLEQRAQLREVEQKEYEERKKEFDVGFEDAGKIAGWKPYDQNENTDWFDPEWMFGVKHGFDVTIGNPPYVRADSGDEHLAMRQKIENSNQYETLWEKWDLYIPFIERSYKLIKPGGFTTLIVSDAYCHSKYAQKSQNWFLKNSRILRLDFLSKIKVFDAGVHNVTYLFQKADGSHQKPERSVHELEFGAVNLLPTNEQRQLTYRVFFPEDTDFQSLSVPTITLDEICYITKGMVVHADEKRAKGAFRLRDLVSDVRDERHPIPFVEGKHLARWLPSTNKWLEWGTTRAPDLFSRPTFPEIYEVDEKILVQRSPGPDPKACYDGLRLHFTESSVGFLLWHRLAEVRNKSIKKQARYRDETPRRSDLPQREDLEKTSRRFAVKFLLGVMNSTVAHDFLKANRRSNIHLYPNDWKKLPIPDVSTEQQVPIVELVNQILAKKRTNPDADTTTLEKEIDLIVYSLYDLNPEEIAIVEENTV